jgi:SET domain-containing protein
MQVRIDKSTIQGSGVFSTREIKLGDYILQINDSRVKDDLNPLKPELGEHEYHCDYLAAGKVILMKSPERHINHSCDPNTYVKTLASIRQLIALRNISSEEEITYDYCINCHGGEVWQCNCGSNQCRKTIVSGFFDLPLELQLNYLNLLDDWFINEHYEKIVLLKTLTNP